MDNPIKVLRYNVDRLMKSQGWNQARLAEKLGWPAARVSEYLGEKARHEPGLDKIADIAKAFGVSISDLFKEDAAPQPRIERTTLADEVRQAIREEVRSALSESSRKANDPDVAQARELLDELSTLEQDEFRAFVLDRLIQTKKQVAIHRNLGSLAKKRKSGEGA